MWATGDVCVAVMRRLEGKGKEGKGREGKGREEKGREGKERKGKKKQEKKEIEINEIIRMKDERKNEKNTRNGKTKKKFYMLISFISKLFIYFFFYHL